MNSLMTGSATGLTTGWLALALLFGFGGAVQLPCKEQRQARVVARESVEAVYAALPQPARFVPSRIGAQIESVTVSGNYHSSSAYLLGRYRTELDGAAVCDLFLKHLTGEMQWSAVAYRGVCEPRSADGGTRYTLDARQEKYSSADAALTIHIRIHQTLGGAAPTSVEVWVHHTLNRLAALDCARDFQRSPCARAAWAGRHSALRVSGREPSPLRTASVR